MIGIVYRVGNTFSLPFASNFRNIKKTSIFAGFMFTRGTFSFYLPFCDHRIVEVRQFGKWIGSWRSDYILHLIIPWIRVLLEKLTGFQRVKKFSAFCGTRRIITHSQVPVICPYPEPARSCPYPHNHFPKINLNIILPSKPGPSK